MKRNLTWAILISGLALAFPLYAGDKGGKSAHSKSAGREESSPRESGKRQERFAITYAERRTIQEYVQGYGAGKHAKRLPPGLAKKQARGSPLPPGWQDKCVPGEILPGPVYEQSHPLPPELVVKLPAPPEATVTVTVAGKVVRLLEATREILDVFDIHL